MRKSKSSDDKIQCGVSECDLESKRSLSLKRVQSALPELKFKGSSKKVHLCKDHYKQFKKATKKDRQLDKLTWE